MTDIQVLKALQQLPEALKREAFHFIQTLSEKQGTEEKKALRKIPQFGKGKVKMTMSPDFDAPIEDFKDYM